MNSTSAVDHYIRCCDDLDGEILKAMRKVNMTCSSQSGCGEKPRNRSNHKSWEQYFDERSACLVQHKDRWVFRKFGYDMMVSSHRCRELEFKPAAPSTSGVGNMKTVGTSRAMMARAHAQLSRLPSAERIKGRRQRLQRGEPKPEPKPHCR